MVGTTLALRRSRVHDSSVPKNGRRIPAKVQVKAVTKGNIREAQVAKKKRYKHDQMLKVLKKNGFKVVPERATHGTKLVKEGLTRPIIVPKHHGETFPVGLSEDILKAAGIEDP